MAIPKSLFGSTRQVPQTDEENWGDEVTGILGDLIDGLDEIATEDNSGNFVPKSTAASSSLAASATLTPTAGTHLVQGSGGAVTLSNTTAIADGEDGQILDLIGAHATNTVTVLDAANTALNGHVTLALGESIRLRWNDALSVWQELSRST